MSEAFHFPNNIRELRGNRIPLQHISKRTGLGVTRLKLLEKQGLPGELPKITLAAIAGVLGVSVERVFPQTGSETSPPVISELVEAQTTPELKAAESSIRSRKVRMLPPSYNEGRWEVVLDAFVASKVMLANLETSAEERKGWRRAFSQMVMVKSGTKSKPLVFAFDEEADAISFWKEFDGREYVPDLPPPVVEVHHVEAPLPVVSSTEPEMAEDDLTGENADGLVCVEARLSPKLLEFYRGLRIHYGQGLHKAILVRGLAALAADLDL